MLKRLIQFIALILNGLHKPKAWPTNSIINHPETIQRIWQGTCLESSKHNDFGYVLSIVVGGGFGRLETVVTFAKVWGKGMHGPSARRVEVIDIPVCSLGSKLSDLIAIIQYFQVHYPNLTILLDTNGEGAGLALNLKSLKIDFKAIFWGGQCFSTANRRHYVNKRAQAYVTLGAACVNDLFKVLTPMFKAKVESQISTIIYDKDDRGRYKILSKDEMRRRGFVSPDLMDTFAFMFMEGVQYTEHERGQRG